MLIGLIGLSGFWGGRCIKGSGLAYRHETKHPDTKPLTLALTLPDSGFQLRPLCRKSTQHASAPPIKV